MSLIYIYIYTPIFGFDYVVVVVVVVVVLLLLLLLLSVLLDSYTTQCIISLSLTFSTLSLSTLLRFAVCAVVVIAVCLALYLQRRRAIEQRLAGVPIGEVEYRDSAIFESYHAKYGTPHPRAPHRRPSEMHLMANERK